jgi:hypothetical protein
MTGSGPTIVVSGRGLPLRGDDVNTDRIMAARLRTVVEQTAVTARVEFGLIMAGLPRARVPSRRPCGTGSCPTGGTRP